MLTVGASSTCARLRRVSLPIRLPTSSTSVGIPRRAERGATRERGGPTARPPLAARADRPVGHLQGGDPQALDRGGVPHVDAGDHRRLLVDGEFAEMRLVKCRRACMAHPRRRRVRSASMPGMDSIRRQGRGRHRRRQRDRPRPRARVRRGRRAGRRGRRRAGRARRDRGRAPSAITTLTTDVTRFDDVARARRPHLRDVRQVDVLCNNAGVFAGGLDLGATAERLRMDARRQPVGHPARDPRLRAPHDRRATTGPHREHGVDGRPVRDSVHGAVQRVEVRGARGERMPRPRPRRQSARRSACRSSCPSAVATRIGKSGRNRPDALAGHDERRRGVRRAGTRRPHGRPRSPARAMSRR